ncbi:MAG: FtsX-like permease family protein [Ilumatobacteraceae bacterium]
MTPTSSSSARCRSSSSVATPGSTPRCWSTFPATTSGSGSSCERTLTNGRINAAIESPDYANGTTSEDGELNSAELAWGWVAGAIALAAVGIIISAAFATSARRQLVTVGQLSSNGASQRVIVRALGMQGLWTGLVGAAGGVAGGVALAVGGRGTAERIAGRDFPPTFIAPIDLVVIAVTGVLAAVIAATIPARSAARVPTLTALAGRRPLSAVPRRLVPIGVALFGLGVLLLVLAAGNTSGGNLPAATAVLGGIAVMIGMCCCSPVAIDAMSRVTARLGGARRFAGRSLSRTRARSAAIVTAIGVTGAIAIAGASVVSAMAQEDDDEPRSFPKDVVTAAPIVDYELVPQTVDAVVSSELRDRVAEAVPGIRWHDRRVVSPGDRGTQEGGMRRGRLVLGDGIGIVVADEATMDLYELPQADRERARRDTEHCCSTTGTA